VGWIHLAQNRDYFKQGSKPWGYRELREFRYKLNNYQLLKDSVA
jgi:hypothetical protein